MNAWIEAIEASISAYQADNRKRGEGGARQRAAAAGPPGQRPRLRDHARQVPHAAGVHEATQRRRAFWASGLVPAITDAMWRDSFLKDKDLLRPTAAASSPPRSARSIRP